MSVSSVYVREIAQGDGQNTRFAFPWKFVAAADVLVYVDDVLQISSQYDIEFPITKDNGVVVFKTAPAVGAVVVIRRADNMQQARLFKNQENFNAHEVEKAFDKLTLLVQEGFEELRRGALTMQSQSNLDYTIEDLTINDGMLALDLTTKTYRQTSFTQKQVQKVIDEAIRSADLSVRNQKWDGDTLTITFGDGTTIKGVSSDNVAQLRAQHDDKNRWWIEWSLDGMTWQGVGGIAGGSVHNNLIERDAADAHPITAITGLQSALSAITEELGEIQNIEDMVDAVKAFVGYIDGGTLNEFLGLSDDSYSATMGNSEDGGYIVYENKAESTRGTIRMNGAIPQMVYESTADPAAFVFKVEVHDDGLYVSNSITTDNFVRVPTVADLGSILKNVAINSDDASTTKLDLTRYDAQTGAITFDQVPLPVANENQAGIWNPSMYAGFLTMQNNVNTLLDTQAIPSVDLETDSPTSAECTTAYTNAEGHAPSSGSRLYNTFNQGVWLCLDGTNWVMVSGTTVGNAIATTSTPGVVLSTNADGMVYVEVNGGMSVVGWDGIKTSVNNNTNNIATLQSQVSILQSASGNYVMRAGDTMTGALRIQTSDTANVGFLLENTSGATLANLMFADGGARITGSSLGGGITVIYNALRPINNNAATLGQSSRCWANTYTGKLNAGGSAGDLIVPTTAGTLARVEDMPTVPPVIVSVVANDTTGVLTVAFSKIPTNKMVYALATGNEIAGVWTLISGSTYRFTPTAAADITENDWGVSCS